MQKGMEFVQACWIAQQRLDDWANSIDENELKKYFQQFANIQDHLERAIHHAEGILKLEDS